jgi:hypothetical protein
MVAKITTPISINRALNYNEQKVQKGTAQCLFAGNFLHRADELNFYQKLAWFQKLIEQNTSKTNTLHISLNFHVSENFSKEKFIEMAETYMRKIGFGEQPFLVYQHFDAGHPHLHIVTTNIKENGSRIDTYNIGKNQSQKARKEIEAAYGLTKADKKCNEQKDKVEAIPVQKIRYGSAETKRSISNVLGHVINQYKYASIAELNAVLKLYNVVADRGSEESRTYKNRGLHYRLLDEKGNKIGVPIKASSIYLKPTLKYLEEKFTQNESLRSPYKARLKTAIDWSLSKKPASLHEFVSALKKENITAVIRQNEEGFMYGITFIDHRNKTVFNGSALGKNYSAARIKERIAGGAAEQKPLVNLLSKKETNASLLLKAKEPSRQENEALEQKEKGADLTKDNLLQLLMNKEKMGPGIPYDFIKKKKKRKKPKL